MKDAFICDAIRTPIGRYAGSLASIRADDLGAIPLKALQLRNRAVDWSCLDDVYLGCANQAGEDNRNIARMSSLLSGLPITAAAVTVNRLCGSGMDAVGLAARAIKCSEAEFVIAGGVESMSRAPLVMPKPDAAFSRRAEIFDTTMGWRFVNPKLEQLVGVDSMPETAENVAEKFSVSREDQDKFAVQSQQKASAAQLHLAEEITPVFVPQRKKEPIEFKHDEHIRPTTDLNALSRLPTPFRDHGVITAGNASGINDGACALLIASEDAIKTHQLQPKARILGTVSVGVEPKFMGMGPVDASRKLLAQTGLTLDQMDVIELNEAFAAQALAVMRQLQLQDNDERINPNGGAIALGHPLGMSGARLITTAVYQLQRIKGRYALCAMCIGVGQGIAIIIENMGNK